MHITCVICSDLITGSDDTFVTNCGHLFHYNCVIQWLERAKTCPQCRTKTSEKSIHRVYFTVANIDGADDPSSLQNKLDNMKFQIRLKELDIKNAKVATTELTSKNKALRDEIKELEEKLATADGAVLSLKSQARQLKVQNQRMEELRSENIKLQERLQTMMGLETIRSGTPAEVDDLLSTMVDPSSSESKSLATYCSALKRELQGMVEKRRLAQERLKEFSNNLMRAYGERDRLKESLQEKSKEEARLKEELAHVVEDHCRLQQKLKDWKGYFERLQKPEGKGTAIDLLANLVMKTPSKESTATEMLRLLTESPAPEELLAKMKIALQSPMLSDPTLEVPKQSSSKGAYPKHNVNRGEKSPTKLPTKSAVVDIMPNRFGGARVLTESKQRNVHKDIQNPQKGYSIFQKQRLSSKPGYTLPAVVREEMHYDGMGGHSRPDVFPDPKRPKVILGARPKVKIMTSTPNKPKP